jgi:predicted AlkP superfamily pyrophosphatase or phosphodiesterase
MLHQGATYRGYVATSSLSSLVSAALAEDQSTPTYVYAYWPTVDTIAHVVGPRTDEHSAEVAAFDTAFARMLGKLDGDRTLVLFTADHGHVDSGPDRVVWLDEHTDLLAMLRQPVAGERRAVYLYVADGQVDAVMSYARTRLNDIATAMTRDEAIAYGLFGPSPISDRALGRIGDVLLFPRGALQLAATIRGPDGVPVQQPPFRGLHGGLTEDEALVPLLAVRV